MQMRMLYMLLKKSFAVSCSVGWLKLNSSCIIVVVSSYFRLTLQNYYIKLLKLVSISKNFTKKCTFLLKEVHYC